MRRVLLAGLLFSGFSTATVGCSKDKDVAPAPAAPVAAAPVVAAPAAPVAAVAAPAAGTAAAPGTAGAPGMPAGMPNAAQIAALQQQALQQAGAVQQKTAVNWRQITPSLTDSLGGWQADGDAKGETSAVGAMSISKADRNYVKAGKHASIEIVDTAVMPALANGFQMMRMASSDASDHYAHGLDLSGNPAWEEWRKGGSSELTALVGGRFLVKVKAGDQPDAKAAEEIANKLNLAQIAALNK